MISAKKELTPAFQIVKNDLFIHTPSKAAVYPPQLAEHYYPVLYPG